jgi:DNA polymerase V
MLLDLVDATTEQHELGLDVPPEDRGNLMDAMDKLNRRYGRGTVASGSVGVGGRQIRWQMRQDMRTPDYTTSWDGMPIARA